MFICCCIISIRVSGGLLAIPKVSVCSNLEISVTVGLDDQLYPHLKQSVELSLQYLPGLGVLCGDLEGQGHGLPGEALVQRYQSTVHTTLYQVTGVVLGIFQW